MEFYKKDERDMEAMIALLKPIRHEPERVEREAREELWREEQRRKRVSGFDSLIL